jgi:hypothetical protein
MWKILKNEQSPVFALILIAIIFSATALYLPWWSINTSPETTLFVNSSIKTDYYLSQIVTAVKSLNNNTEIQSVLLYNLTENQENIGLLSLCFNVTYAILLIGLGLSCLMLIVIILPGLGKIFYRYLSFIACIAAILLFIAPILFAGILSTEVSKLSRLTPVSIPLTWTSVTPNDIKGFWGSIKIQTSLNFPEWTKGGDFWVWGADTGWYLAFTASLLTFTTALLINTILKKRGV